MQHEPFGSIGDTDSDRLAAHPVSAARRHAADEIVLRELLDRSPSDAADGPDRGATACATRRAGALLNLSIRRIRRNRRLTVPSWAVRLSGHVSIPGRQEARAG